MSKAALTAIIAIWFAAAFPASACPGSFAEKYLLWFDLPDLLPGEVAIEIDAKDIAERLSGGPLLEAPFKVKRVLAGEFDGDVIQATRDRVNCAHDFAEGASSRLILLGKIEKSANGTPVLAARYMPYDHSFAVEARRKAEAPSWNGPRR